MSLDERQKDLSCYRINEADDSLKVKSHRLCDGLYCHSANYLEAFLSVYLETNSGSNSVMGILNYCCPAK